MFADFKSRGLRFQDTRLQRPERISRLLLVLTIAMTWATANGQIVKKTALTGSLQQIARSALSLCKQGLRYLVTCAPSLTIPYPLKIMGW